MNTRKVFSWLLSLSLILSSTAFGEVTLPSGQRTNLSLAQYDALVQAEKVQGDLEWQVMTTEVDGRPRAVVLLGEYHYAFPQDLEASKKVFDQFDQFAIENGGHHNEKRYNYKIAPLAFTLMMPAAILSQLLEGRVSSSPMDFPSTSKQVKGLHNAEILHHPTLGEEFDLGFLAAASAGGIISIGYMLRSLVRMVRTGHIHGHKLGLFKAVGAYIGIQLASAVWAHNVTERPLLKNRDVDMAKFIDQWVHDPSNDQVLVVVVGKLHLPNLKEFLTKTYHFQAGQLECGPSGCGVLANN